MSPLARLGDRELFPTLDSRVYLAHAAISPLPTVASEAVAAILASYAQRGFFAWTRGLEARQALRSELAAFIGAAPADLALTSGTTASLSALAQSFPWRAGDGVVVFRGEFPTNVTPWLEAARAHDLRVHWLDAADCAPGGPGLDQLDALLRAHRVALVAMSAVQFQTGLRMPVAEAAALCHERGAALSVDAIQAVGALPVDVTAEGADFVSGGAHKWLMGIEGTGWLYAAPRWRGRLGTQLAGWLSHEDPVRFLGEADQLRYDRPIRPGIDFLEGGSASVVGAVALRASLGLLRELGPAAIYAHVDGWLERCERGLVALGFRSLRTPDPRGRSGILALLPPEDVDLVAIRDGLIARGIAVTAPDGILRIAPHWPNRAEEVDVVLDVMGELLGELRG